MDKLPREVISMIIIHLGDQLPHAWYVEDRPGQRVVYKDRIFRNELAQYSTISRRWQSMIEAATFRHLLLTQARLETALQVMTPSRLSHLRFVGVDCVFDSDDHLEFLNEHAGSIIQSLFRLLKATPLTANPSITVCLSTFLPQHVIEARLKKMRFKRPGMCITDIHEVSIGIKSVTYLEPCREVYHDLPDLPMVSGFTLSLKNYGVAFAPRFICLIASKMSRLEKVQWELNDAEKLDPELRIRQRDGFAESLDMLPMSIKDLKIIYRREAPQNEHFQPPSIIPAGHVDHLSRALHLLSQRPNFVKFWFEGCVDSEMLWPSQMDGDKPPRWPNMREFRVEMMDVLPSGKWVALPDPELEEWGNPFPDSSPVPGSGPIPSEMAASRFLLRTDMQIFDESCLAAGKAAGQMSNLQRLFVNFGGGDNGCCTLYAELDFEPRPSRRSEQNDPVPPLRIKTDPAPKLSEETIKTWRETSARQGVGFWMRLEHPDLFAVTRKGVRDVR